MQVSDNYTVTSQQLSKSLMKAFKINRPVFIWGPPGIGKSEVVESVCKKLNGHLIDLRLAQMESIDIRGTPFYNKELNKMDWAPPIDLPDEELASKYSIVVLFLDELNSAPPQTQAVTYQLMLNRRIGTYRLPDNVVMVAGGNSDSDRGVTYRMPTPLANRLIHLEMRVDFDSYQQWAVENKINQQVLGYLIRNKQDLHNFDPKSSSRAFPTPRTWTFVSQLIDLDPEDTSDELYSLIVGAIGEGLATKFASHRKFVAQMPEPMDILTGKVKEMAVKEISAMYSLTVSMCYELKEQHDKKLDSKKLSVMIDNFLTFMMNNFETELVIMGAKTAISSYGLPLDPSNLTCFEEFHKKYGKYIVGAVS